MGLILSGVALNSAYAAQDGEEGSSDIEITDSQEDDTNTDEEKQSRAVNLSEEDLIEPYANTGGLRQEQGLRVAMKWGYIQRQAVWLPMLWGIGRWQRKNTPM